MVRRAGGGGGRRPVENVTGKEWCREWECPFPRGKRGMNGVETEADWKLFEGVNLEV